jgi:hypothetical protein
MDDENVICDELREIITDCLKYNPEERPDIE